MRCRERGLWRRREAERAGAERLPAALLEDNPHYAEVAA